RGIDRGHRRDHEQRVAVGGCLHDRLGGDVAAGARPILDDELLAETLRKPLPDQPRDNVGGAAGGKSHQQAHRPRRIGLRCGNTQRQRKCRGTGGEAQKTATPNVHLEPTRWQGGGCTHMFAAMRGRGGGAGEPFGRSKRPLGRPSKNASTSEVFTTSAYFAFMSHRLIAWLACERSKQPSSARAMR